MSKTVINSTEGGARIKGTIQMTLKEAVEKYCQVPIDKSKLAGLLSLAEDGDRLISRVIPLLENDIKNLETIISNSRKGIAINKGIVKMMDRSAKAGKKIITRRHEKIFEQKIKESAIATQGQFVLTNTYFYESLLKEFKEKGDLRTLIQLSKKNFLVSEAAHIASAMNPLVNVAIYGASRAIQGKRLKVDETLTTFLKDRSIADIRIERNNLILGTAKKASESLLKSYKATLELLKKYDETKDDSLLRTDEEEPINLDDAEQYFSSGNWAHPYLDAIRAMDKYELGTPDFKKAEGIYIKSTIMKDEAIEKAKEYERENGKRDSDLLRHNWLIEQSQEEGKKGDFEKAHETILKALELIPDSQDAQWGLATCLNHLKRYDESILQYQILINRQDRDKPGDPKYRFEMGQVMILGGYTKEGLKEISKAMETTNEFDNFLAHIGEIYKNLGLNDEAIKAYALYLERFPFDFQAWEKHGDCLSVLGKKEESEESYRKAKRIRV